ncbi:hypothetical protein HNQ02_000697 [Flavobacterium sp. 7E]|uniref:DUF7017 domain-containing protein n=1 Tax=Flavobacterium sp. 7E TaxID=2735898 RepID=UPI00156F2D52|nr:hypothetical protein [Flavobacterium sp. 7E]NRS87790.1 hypothetical protein [Flavobacterium sp. 7E]
MPSKEIKELRQAGKLEDALTMAKNELEVQPDNIWGKRNISWVYYEFLKLNAIPEHVDSFISWLKEIQNLMLPEEEKILFDNLAWQIGSIVFKIANTTDTSRFGKLFQLLEISQTFHYTKPSEGYSFLFKAFHKSLKETDKYISFADWWSFENFRKEDFEKEKLDNGREMMAIVEQAYIAYAKHLLPKQSFDGEIIFSKNNAKDFIPKLAEIEDKYPDYQYPAYFTAKLLLAVGDEEHMLEHLLPFAKKKRNDFWVWEILAEAFINDASKVFACYCKALSCKSPEEMLVNLRQKMAGLLIKNQNFNEAKTEIELLVKSRSQKGYRIPNDVINWQSQDWYKNAITQKNNLDFYRKNLPEAESLLFYDVAEETIIIDFVNSDKKMLNFIASETKYGYLKYDRFFKNVNIGDVLKVRFQRGSNEGMQQLYTAVKINDDSFKNQFMKEVEGTVRIPEGKPFGFIEDVFIHPSLVTKLKLTNGMTFNGNTIKSYNKDKKQWSWKLIKI